MHNYGEAEKKIMVMDGIAKQLQNEETRVHKKAW